ncbi:hypothetical protein Tco_0636280 [Tanacetum coccineum]
MPSHCCKLVEKRFRGNAATKKTQRNLLKQQYENFTASSSEVLDQTFDRLQKLISQLEIHGESISQEDVNQKFLRSLSPEWNTHTIVWRNKPEIDTLSLDDLYNNLKIYEPEVKGTSSSNTQNVAFVSSNSTNSTNGAVNTAHGATTASTQATTVNSTTIDNLSDAVCKSGGVLPNCPTNGILGKRSVGAPKRTKETGNRENTIRVVLVETTTSNALMVLVMIRVIKKKKSVRIVDKCKTEEFVNEPIVSEPTVKKPVVETSEAKTSKAKPKVVRKNNGAPIIEDQT